MASSRAGVVSSFTIIKGSMVEETYAIMRDWDCERSREENLREVRDNNTIGASSANWLRDVYKVLHRRFDPNRTDRPLVLLAKHGVPMDVWKPIQLWHMTRDEFLLRDFLVNWLYGEHQDGAYRIRAEDLHPYLRALHKKGLVEEEWKDSTLRRVASALLRMAVDFGLMSGSTHREFISYHLPEETFLYLLHAMYEAHGNPRDVVQSPDWRLFLMSPTDVERELLRLHQFRKLRYEVAGSLVELTLPCRSVAEFIDEMAA